MTENDRPLTGEPLIREHVAALIGPAIRRQCWLLFVDRDLLPLDLLMPIDDLPVDADPDDLARFTAAIGRVVETVGAHAVVVVWERPGGTELRMHEAGWVLAVEHAGLPLLAQLLASDDEVRIVDPDRELAADAA